MSRDPRRSLRGGTALPGDQPDRIRGHFAEQPGRAHSRFYDLMTVRGDALDDSGFAVPLVTRRRREYGCASLTISSFHRRRAREQVGKALAFVLRPER